LNQKTADPCPLQNELLYHNDQGNNIIDTQSESCIFVDVDDLLLSGRNITQKNFPPEFAYCNRISLPTTKKSSEHQSYEGRKWEPFQPVLTEWWGCPCRARRYALISGHQVKVSSFFVWHVTFYRVGSPAMNSPRISPTGRDWF
jgi:hypothetical protein